MNDINPTPSPSGGDFLNEPIQPSPAAATPTPTSLGTTGSGSVGGTPAITPATTPTPAPILPTTPEPLSVTPNPAPHPEPEGTLQDHPDPNPIFPGSVIAAEHAQPASVYPHDHPESKGMKLFGLGFLLGALIFGGLTGFLLNSYYNTQKSQLELKATQQLQQLKNQATTTPATTAPSATPATGY